MKRRIGFVSNSSSSSFIIASKEKLTKKKLMEYFNVNEKSPLYTVAKDISKSLIDMSEEYTLEKFKDEHDCTDEEADEWYGGVFKEAKNRNIEHIYYGCAGNDGDAIENMICEMSMNFVSDDLIIWKDSSY